MKNQIQRPDDTEGTTDYSRKLGILEWFHKEDRIHVENTIKDLKLLGIKELRTGISWADFQGTNGNDWYDWLLPLLAKDFNLLPCILYTPPAFGIEPTMISPEQEPEMFADFVKMVIDRYGNYFDYIELWNEPNNIRSYNYRLDYSWERFVEMIILASSRAKLMGKKTVLGGISPIDPYWFASAACRQLLDHIDIVGIHGFPQVYDAIWNGWNQEIDKINQVISLYGSKAEIWITETGYSTWKHDEQEQIFKFNDALNAPVSRVYWNSLYDLPPSYQIRDGYSQDERDYHFGMKRSNGITKLLFRALSTHGVKNLAKENLVVKKTTVRPKREKAILITGGAGFIGTNVADRLLTQGKRVIIYDNLSRNGVETNLNWLVSKYPYTEVMIADVRDSFRINKAVNEAEHIFHFAAQVAVTTSLIFPDYDYEVNLEGTIGLLEAIRKSTHRPSLIFTSTNKVYGDLSGLELLDNESRYFPANTQYFHNGINEEYPLNFHSPYGNSKGSADQYILDYSRSFGMRNVVFRMSCIYGPRQFGTEDQGWVAHFINQSIKNKKIILYGDGKQVRDILYIDDLVNAFLLAKQNIEKLSGEAFNIGGGPSNALSLIELLEQMNRLDHLNIQILYDKWRTGDQKYYVSDTRKFNRKTGWQPTVNYVKGLINLYNWLYSYSKYQEKTMV